jgi:hypothetical protein
MTGPRISIREPALFTRLRDCQHVVIAGAGGGFDVFAGLPIALALQAAGKRVSFANLTFSYLGGTDVRWIAGNLAEVTPGTRGEDKYFPERALARWLAAQSLPSTVYAFEKVGVRPLKAAWAALCERLRPDGIVLVDGGTDILMFGDEAGLGTPQEDMVSLAAVASMDVRERLVACIGFGVDSHHGVCHAHFLENVATLERDGAYLGSFSVPARSAEGAKFLEAVDFAQASAPGRPSIVNGSISAAVRGQFGDVQFTTRTAGNELFINPLMGLYFTFDLPGVARRSGYLHLLEETDTIFQVSQVIERYRETIEPRPRRLIPH